MSTAATELSPSHRPLTAPPRGPAGQGAEESGREARQARVYDALATDHPPFLGGAARWGLARRWRRAWSNRGAAQSSRPLAAKLWPRKLLPSLPQPNPPASSSCLLSRPSSHPATIPSSCTLPFSAASCSPPDNTNPSPRPAPSLAACDVTRPPARHHRKVAACCLSAPLARPTSIARATIPRGDAIITTRPFFAN